MDRDAPACLAKLVPDGSDHRFGSTPIFGDQLLAALLRSDRGLPPLVTAEHLLTRRNDLDSGTSDLAHSALRDAERLETSGISATRQRPGVGWPCACPLAVVADGP